MGFSLCVVRVLVLFCFGLVLVIVFLFLFVLYGGFIFKIFFGENGLLVKV